MAAKHNENKSGVNLVFTLDLKNTKTNTYL